MWKALCKVLLFVLQANLQVQWCFRCDKLQVKVLTLTRSCDLEVSVRNTQKYVPASHPLLPQWSSHYLEQAVERKAVRIIYISVYFSLRCHKYSSMD